MSKQKTIILSILIILIFFVLSDKSSSDQKNSSFTINDFQKSKLEKLSKKRIYYGHRSIGNNIITGIRDLMKENSQIKFNIIKPGDRVNHKEGFFMHSMISQNASPKSIADDYEKLMSEVSGEYFDIVFIRYTPFYDKSDLKDIFADYKETLRLLKNKYPKTIFVHGTFPLNRSKTSWKTWIKKIFGKKDIWEYEQNIKVNEFNKLLRKEYYAKEPFFDIAKFQSTYPNGKRSTFTKDGKTYFHTVSDYTYDGVHLNERGRKIVAEQLLMLFADVI
jgi:hypothetical protein